MVTAVLGCYDNQQCVLTLFNNHGLFTGSVYGYFSWSVFPLVLGAGTGNLGQSFIDTFSVGSWPWTHPLISERSLVRALRPETLLLTKKGVPTRWKECFLRLFVQESKQMAHPALTKDFLQAAATAAMHCQPEQWTHPPLPVPSFLLAQNLSSKRIAPTDCANW